MVSIIRYFMFLDGSLAHSIQICLPTSVLVVSAASGIIHGMAASATSKRQEAEWQQKEKTLTEEQEKSEKHGS